MAVKSRRRWYHILFIPAQETVAIHGGKGISGG